MHLYQLLTNYKLIFHFKSWICSCNQSTWHFVFHHSIAHGRPMFYHATVTFYEPTHCLVGVSPFQNLNFRHWSPVLCELLLLKKDNKRFCVIQMRVYGAHNWKSGMRVAPRAIVYGKRTSNRLWSKSYITYIVTCHLRTMCTSIRVHILSSI